MKAISRRQFINYGFGGAAALAVGSNLPPWILRDKAYAATQTLNFTIADVLKDMVTHQDPALNADANIAQCYFWLYKSTEPDLLADVPGPIVFAFEGDTVMVNLKNTLPQAHNFSIPSANVVSPTLDPATPESPSSVSFEFTVDFPAGTYLYYDSLNEPVNRMMGLHGAFIVMPRPANGTPYSAADVAANPKMAQLFADLGAQPWFPGLHWGQGAENPDGLPPTPPFRQHVWLLHEASPVLFAEVGNTTGDFHAATFVDAFLNNPLITQGANKAPEENRTPQYFTISGQSGHFSHISPFISPTLRVGEPCVIRVLNAGLWTHSLHIHSNHVYVLAANNRFRFQQDVLPGEVDNHIFIDTFTARPLDTWDWLDPFTRPPDVPNSLGIGRPDLSQPLPVNPAPVPEFGMVHRPDGRETAGDTPPGVTTWPPVQELNMAIPKVGTRAGNTPIHGMMSPLCFPMHDHSEASQTSQGGNYNLGMIAGMNFSGDRNADGKLPGGVITFPHAPTVFGPDSNESPQAGGGPEPPYPEVE